MRVLGWVLFAATCAMFALQWYFLWASSFPMTSYEVLVDQVFPLLGIGAMVGAGVGALIVSRYPRNLIGWLFLVGQLGNAIGLAAEAFGVLVVQGVAGSRVAGQVAGYLGQVFSTIFAVSVISVIFMIVPDGRLLSRRWRLGIAVPIAAVAMNWVGIVLLPAGAFVPGAVVDLQGVSETLADALIGASFFAMLLSVSLGAVALLLRMRRSTGQQRLQLRWIATGAAVLAVTFVVFAASQLINPRATPWILPEATCVAYIFFSVTVGVAIFRYRLYDIDVILNRAIVLGTLAVFVSAGYIVVVVAIGAVLQAVGAPGSTLYWPSLVATALVAVAFQPVRRHVLRLADRLVYGDRAAPYEALATLSRRLADSASPGAAPAKVAEATGHAVGAAGIVVRLGKPGELAQPRSAAWSDTDDTGPVRTAGATQLLPVLDMAEQVGSIEVTMPPGRALRTFERDLLQDVAAQAGVAFRNALLEAELTARVEQGEALAAELSESRRRLLGVEDEAQERLAGAIRRNVVPHLATVDAELTSYTTADQPLPDQLEPLIDEVERAQQELRTVCRGLFPALLDRRGLIPALTAQLELTHPHTRLDIHETADRRLDRAVEAGGYLFCVQVAPTDRSSLVRLRVDADRLIAAVTADPDWATEPRFSDGITMLAAWQQSRDRVDALNGAMNMQRTDSGLTVTAVIPLHPEQSREPAAAANGTTNLPHH